MDKNDSVTIAPNRGLFDDGSKSSADDRTIPAGTHS
jgi:hypothetical protein